MTQSFINLLTRIQETPNYLSPSAYDTAWVAWLYPRAREWLINAQRPDGSWGSEVEYFHGRIIATLSAINAIAATTVNNHDLQRMERGIRYLERAIPRLSEDIFESISFELLLPSLTDTGIALGLNLHHVKALIELQIMPFYRQKLALLTPIEIIYSPKNPFAYVLEFIGFKNLDRTALAELIASNGSIHSSPAVTAFAEITTPGSTARQGYLNALMDRYNGAVPGMTPCELFEIIWALYHFSLSDEVQSLKPAIDPIIKSLIQAWTEKGVGITSNFVPDGDSTALALKIFNAVGVDVDPTVLEVYESKDHFQCYPCERNISLGVHIHTVEALKSAKDFPRKDDMLSKALNVLRRHLIANEYIVDKWHASPYYSTARVVNSLVGLSDNIITKQINWLLKTQREDGSWTFYPHCPQAAIEETAYALMALMKVYEKTRSIPFEVIDKGGRYLTTHYTSIETLPALWIGKELYNPYYVVESIILSVMVKYQTLCQKTIKTFGG